MQTDKNDLVESPRCIPNTTGRQARFIRYCGNPIMSDGKEYPVSVWFDYGKGPLLMAHYFTHDRQSGPHIHTTARIERIPATNRSLTPKQFSSRCS